MLSNSTVFDLKNGIKMIMYWIPGEFREYRIYNDEQFTRVSKVLFVDLLKIYLKLGLVKNKRIWIFKRTTL